MIHTTECLLELAQFQELLHKFEEAHPNFCLDCMGRGFILSRGDLVPYGSTSIFLPDESTPCPSCLSKSLCPHCHSPVEYKNPPLDELAFCPSCGWDEETSEGLPPEPFCACWLPPEN